MYGKCIFVREEADNGDGKPARQHCGAVKYYP